MAVKVGDAVEVKGHGRRLVHWNFILLSVIRQTIKNGSESGRTSMAGKIIMCSDVVVIAVKSRRRQKQFTYVNIFMAEASLPHAITPEQFLPPLPF